MKPIYFPFTFMSEPVLREMNIFFPQTIIYQPSSTKIPLFIQKSADDGLLEIRAPFGGDETKFDGLVREYRQWLEYRQGSETTFFKTRIFDGTGMETIPMYSENATSQIKHEIKKGHFEDKPQKPDAEFTARLFLLIAQEFDIQQNEFNLDLERFQLMENDLFSNMRGENESPETSSSKTNKPVYTDLGSYNTGQRLSAWLKIFEGDPVPPDEFGSVLFITSSNAVLEHMMDLCPDSEMILCSGPVRAEDRQPENIKEMQHMLQENLTRFSKEGFGKEPVILPQPVSKNDLFPSLKIFCFPRKSLWAICGEAKNQSDDVHKNIDVPGYQKIFIGIIERMQP